MAALLSAVGSVGSTLGSAGLGSTLGNVLGGGSVGSFLGNLVGGSISSDINHDTSGALNMLGAPNGQQTGAASTQQQAQAPQSLSPVNTNQYTPPTYGSISGSTSPYGGLLTKLLGQ